MDKKGRDRGAGAADGELLRLQFLLEHTGEEIYVLTEEGRFSYVNRAVCDRLGYDRAELVGRSLFEIDADWTPARLEGVLAALSSGDAAPFEVRLHAKDGRVLFTELKAQVLQIEGQSFLCAFGRDMTSRRRAEEELRQQEAKFRRLLENLQDVIVVLGPRGEILYESPSMERVLGHRPQEREGQNAFEYVHPDDVEALMDFGISRLNVPGPVPAFSLRFRHADGSYRHLEAVGANLLEDPAVQGVVITLRDVTLRVEAESRLQEALQRAEQEQAKTEAILASVGDGISIQDPEMRVLYQNQHLREMIGDHVGESCYRVYECRESVCEGCPVALSFADGGVHTVERRIARPGAREQFMEITASSVRDSAGRVVCGIELVRDVTARKAEERIRAESERNYRLLFERNMAGVYRATLGGKILECNEAFARILGCPSREDVMTLGAETFYTDPAERAAFLDRLQRDGAVNNLREHLRGCDGRPITILLNAHLIREGDGLPLVEGTLIDISELERAAEALRESEGRLKEVVEHSTNLFYTHTADHVLTYVSPQSRHFFDCEPEEAMVRWTELVTDNPVNLQGMAATQRAIDTGIRQPPYELELKTRLDRSVWVEVNEAPVLKDGQTVAIVGSLTDITARKRAEAETEALQAKLQQAQKLESMGVLAGGLAHDFNNLLVGMLGNAELALLDPTLPTPVRHRLEEVRMAAIRASELTGHMLAYAGQAPADIHPLDLNRLTEDMAVLMEATISRRAVLRYSFSKDLPAVEADPVQLRQVVMNLILNASEALGDKGGLIQLGTSLLDLRGEDLAGMLLGQDLPPGPYLCLAVSDTGCGIAPDTLSRIFDPFFSTRPSGRGLGLAVVLGIVRSHRGTLHVFSEVGRGSRFEVYLPAAPPNRQAAAEDEGVGPEEALPAEPGSGTVLVVDDDPGVLAVTTAMLEGVGYTVRGVADGPSALSYAQDRQAPLDAVMLDMTLGEMDGEEVLSQLRTLRPGLPVILLTGGAPREVERYTAGSRVEGLVRKPFRRSELIKALRSVLKK